MYVYEYVYMCIHYYSVQRPEYACTCVYVLISLSLCLFLTHYISLGIRKKLPPHSPHLLYSSVTLIPGSSHFFSMLKISCLSVHFE